jgi:hypothetical protein
VLWLVWCLLWFTLGYELNEYIKRLCLRHRMLKTRTEISTAPRNAVKESATVLTYLWTVLFVWSATLEFSKGDPPSHWDRQCTYNRINVLLKQGITLHGHSDLRHAVAWPCWLQLCAVLGSSGIKISGCHSTGSFSLISPRGVHMTAVAWLPYCDALKHSTTEAWPAYPRCTAATAH